MAANDDAAVVHAWLTAIDEGRLDDALDLLGEGWVDHGPDGYASGRDEFFAAASGFQEQGPMRLTIHGQVSTGGYVATQVSWLGEDRRLDFLRLDVVQNGRLTDSNFQPTSPS